MIKWNNSNCKEFLLGSGKFSQNHHKDLLCKERKKEKNRLLQNIS